MNGTLDTKTYTKKPKRLHRTSSHPNSVFKGFIKGEIIRHIRNTNSRLELHKLIEAFKTRLLNIGYILAEINRIITETINMNRNE